MRTLLAALLLVAIAGAAQAQSALSPQDHDAIQGVITGQLDAFRRDDAVGAFGYAAPSTQGIFGTPGTFLEMVRRGYPPVYRPHSVEFAGTGESEAGITQDVELTGPDGLPYTARYTVEREPDGSWRIVACELLQSRRLGV